MVHRVVGPPQNICNRKRQKGGGGVCAEQDDGKSIQGLARVKGRKARTIQVCTNKYNCLLHKYPPTCPPLRPAPNYLVTPPICETRCYVLGIFYKTNLYLSSQ